MAGLSPTQRTLRELRQRGMLCGIVERFNAHVGPHGIRQDLFGIIDLIALDPVRGIVGIQTTGQDFTKHLRGMLEGDERDDGRSLSKPEAVHQWLRCKGHLELWGWRKVKLKRGGKAMRWKPRVAVFSLGGPDGIMATELP